QPSFGQNPLLWAAPFQSNYRTPVFKFEILSSSVLRSGLRLCFVSIFTFYSIFFLTRAAALFPSLACGLLQGPAQSRFTVRSSVLQRLLQSGSRLPRIGTDPA